MREYKPLDSHPAAAGARLARPGDTAYPLVTLDSPAIAVMTDLARVDAVTIEPHASMDSANQTMIRLGVRLLFVHGPDGSLDGLITATDILGEKPMRLVQERALKHDEIQVADLLTPLEQVEALSFDEVRHAHVGNIVATLQQSGRLHALVIERSATGGVQVRGIFSLSQISRQMGVPISASASAHTFSELVTQLS